MLAKRLVDAYSTISIGDPLDSGTLMGPMISEQAVETTRAAVAIALGQGGELLYGGEVLDRPGNFFQPTLVRIPGDAAIVQEETFGPVMYLIEVDTLDEAINVQNGVRQGLSSAIFTDSVRSAERFLSARAATVESPTSTSAPREPRSAVRLAARRKTGGGRESGSDSWKALHATSDCDHQLLDGPTPGAGHRVRLSEPAQRRPYGCDQSVGVVVIKDQWRLDLDDAVPRTVHLKKHAARFGVLHHPVAIVPVSSSIPKNRPGPRTSTIRVSSIANSDSTR